MAKVSAERLLELVKRSELAEEAQLKQVLQEIKESNAGSLPTSVEDFADALVRSGLFTRWQADNLMQGKHKGFILGKYKLLRHLGRGGMSNVYLAEHIVMKRQVAIKVLPQNKVDDSSYLDRFKLEAQAAAKLDHPNIVRAYDYDTDAEKKAYYLVMEFVEGRDLQNIVQEDGPFDYDLAADFIAQAATGLQHAHDAGLIHRDIKPANCLVDQKNIVKILDMGLAKFSQDDRPSLTIAHDENVLGTADYLAPEQALNSHDVDRRADIYSLGCTFYYLLTGHPPFPEGTLPQRLMKHQTEAPSSIYSDRADAPRELVEICEQMMAKSPDSRIQTAHEVSLDLANYLASRGKLVGGGSGSGGSGVLRAAAEEAGLLRPPDSPGRSGLRSRNPAGQPSSGSSIETGPSAVRGDTRAPETDDHENLELAPEPSVPDPPAAAPKEAPSESDEAATKAIKIKDEADELGVKFNDNLDLGEVVMADANTGEGWPRTTVIADRTRRSRNRISPWMWGGMGVGILVLLLLLVMLLGS